MVVCSSKWNTIEPLKLVVPKNVKDSRITLQSIIPKIVVFNDYTKIRPGKTKGLRTNQLIQSVFAQLYVVASL